MGELAIQNLHGSGASKVTVMNRTFEKAEVLQIDLMEKPRSMNELQSALIEADILISSTGAKEFVITKEMIEQLRKNEKASPLFMVDIAVPRDLDPALAELESVFLYDIDDLEGIVEANLTRTEKGS